MAWYIIAIIYLFMPSNRDQMKKIASSGGTATAKKYGSAHFKMLAKRMWKKRRQAPPTPPKEE